MRVGVRRTLLFGTFLLGTGAAVKYVMIQQDKEGFQHEEGPQIQPGGCPVDHTKQPAACPMTSHATEVYSKDNQMPPPNQRPAPDQKAPLPTNRIKSSIPRGPEPEPDKEKWEYPSEQMFYNALKKKGWQGVKEQDMSAIVAIHNTTNERCWAEVLKWELVFHADEYKAAPRLVKFGGKYKQISPKARIKMFFQGVKRPFDRHDWIVQRGDKQVRYIIDFYDGMQSGAVPLAMHLDVRPAVDSFSAVIDRFRMFLGFAPTVSEIYEKYPHLANRMEHK